MADRLTAVREAPAARSTRNVMRNLIRRRATEQLAATYQERAQNPTAVAELTAYHILAENWGWN